MGRGERSWALRGGLRAEGLGSPRRHALRPLGGGLGWKRPSGKVPLQGAGPLRPSHVLRATGQGSQRVLGKPLVPRRPWILGRVEPNEGAWRGLSSGSPAPPCLPPPLRLTQTRGAGGPRGPRSPSGPSGARRPPGNSDVKRCPPARPQNRLADKLIIFSVYPPPVGSWVGAGIPLPGSLPLFSCWVLGPLMLWLAEPLSFE